MFKKVGGLALCAMIFVAIHVMYGGINQPNCNAVIDSRYIRLSRAGGFPP